MCMCMCMCMCTCMCIRHTVIPPKDAESVVQTVARAAVAA